MSQDPLAAKHSRPESPPPDYSTSTRSDQPEVLVFKMRQRIVYKKLPWGIWLLEKLCGSCGSFNPTVLYKFLVLFLTFCAYTSYHLSRKPTSVVKVALCPKCAKCVAPNGSNISIPGWEPFDSDHGETLLGVLDYSWLFSYAIFMYISGFVSDRVNLRWFLSIGMIGSGISVGLLGVAYFANIHKLYYFILVQVVVGIFQSTGWPGVVAVMGHWFGKHNRGLIMGIWNSHTSVGNILGTIIPSFWADCDQDEDAGPWGWSFVVPGLIILVMGIIMYFFLVVDPTHVGIPPPQHHLKADLEDQKGREPSPLRESSPLRGNGVSNGVLPRDVDPDMYGSTNSDKDALINSAYSQGGASVREKPKAINPFRALLIPGVVEYSIALFFNKLVSYTFLFWLPLYIKNTHSDLSGKESDWLSTAFDVGGILGGIIAGFVSDLLHARAITCVTMLILAVPMLLVLESTNVAIWVFVILLVINGALVNGPYGMITTAVSSDLGTHPSLKSNTNAKATVTAIIDGTGSLGAAFGPLLVGLIKNHTADWKAPFYLLMSCCFVSALFLSRLVVTEVISIYRRCTRKPGSEPSS